MKTLPWLVRIYLVLIVLCALWLTAWQLYSHDLPGSDRLPLAGLLSACMLLAWLYPMPIGFKTHFYLDTAVVIAAALLFEPGSAMLITGAGALAAQVIRRRSWDESLFNTGQTMLQAALAAWFLTISGYQPGVVQASATGFVVTILMMGVVLFLASAVMVGTIVSLQGGLNPVTVSLASVIKADETVYMGHLAQVGLGIVIAILGDSHPWTIALLIPPVAVVYKALDQGMELRRRASLALRLQEKNLTEAQRLARVGSWEWDLSNGAQGWSDEAFRILGFEPPFPEASLDRLIERVHPDDREQVNGRIHAAIRFQSSFDLEHRVLCPEDRVRTVHHRGEVIEDATDKRLRVVAMIHDISEQKLLESALEKLAYHDPLTGLINRSRLAAEIDAALDRWRHGGTTFALLFIDLDGFKQVNDSLGHSAGDQVLAEIGKRFERSLRQSDHVARYGGDEFLILARSVTRATEAERLASRVLQHLAQSIAVGNTTITVTASIGIVIPDSRLQTSDELLRHVDSALYEAKSRGKNRYAIYDTAPQKTPTFRIPR